MSQKAIKIAQPRERIPYVEAANQCVYEEPLSLAAVLPGDFVSDSKLNFNI